MRLGGNKKQPVHTTGLKVNLDTTLMLLKCYDKSVQRPKALHTLCIFSSFSFPNGKSRLLMW